MLGGCWRRVERCSAPIAVAMVRARVVRVIEVAERPACWSISEVVFILAPMIFLCYATCIE